MDPLNFTKSKELLIGISRRRGLQRFEERQRKKLRRRGVQQKKVTSPLKSKSKAKPSGWVDYSTPESMDFQGNISQTLVFFNGLHQTFKFNKRVRILFLDLKYISSEVLTYFLGQIYLLKEKHGSSNLSGCYPSNRKVEHLLNESGFFKLLGIKNRAVAGRKNSNTKFLKYKTGNKLDAAQIPEIRRELFGDDFQIPVAVKNNIYRALSEAMTNVGEHAYITKTNIPKSIVGRWWIGASYSLDKNLFSLSFYDAGVGIPKTITRKYNWELINQVLGLLPLFKPDDGAIISAAVEIGRTRTNLENRGLGLMDLHRLIEKANAGKLSIYSRLGWYQYLPNLRTSGHIEVGFVEGTLISWELPLESAAELINKDIVFEEIKV